MLICPKCKGELIKHNSVYHCINNHNYDIAKSGYVNLVLGNQKQSGDSAEMVKARTYFLEQGFYQPLADALIKVLAKLNVHSVVDAGCGEGYYTQQFYKAREDMEIVGFDLSKTAINEASKKDKKTTYAIASIFNMPIDDNTLDVVLNTFAPTPLIEFKRVLKKQGYLIKVGPAEDHLKELKEFLYEDVYENEIEIIQDEAFELIETIHVKEEMQLKNQETINSLFMMTPYYWKTSKEASQRLLNLEEIQTNCSFIIQLYRLMTK